MFFTSHPAVTSTMMMMMMILHGGCPLKVTVHMDELEPEPCKDDERICVTDRSDCGHPTPTSEHRTLNMSCYYEKAQNSMTCELSLEITHPAQHRVSLIFSKEEQIKSCPGIFSPSSILNISARIQRKRGREVRSQPLTVDLGFSVKPPRPVLTVLSTTDDSAAVSWKSQGSSCRLRLGPKSSHIWSQSPDFVSQETWVHTFKNLLPFTVYAAAVSCRGGVWSDWSADVTLRTLDRVPSTSPEIYYRVEKSDSESFPLHLMWKDLRGSAGSPRILGYQVTYESVKKQRLSDKRVLNVTEAMSLLLVKEGKCTISVAAFNTAGYGPSAHLSIDTQRQKNLPSVRNLWVSTLFPEDRGLLLQWNISSVLTSDPPIARFVVLWLSETHPSTSRWATVNSSDTSFVLRDVDPDHSYLLSVFSVHQQQFGALESLPVNLQLGALIAPAHLIVTEVTKTSLTIGWEWQEKSGSVKVSRYQVMLVKTSQTQKTTGVLPLWPDEQQQTFTDLSPDTEYSLHLLADNVATDIINVRTQIDNIPVMATVMTLLPIAATVFILYILSRTVYKSYFFPKISSPRNSTSGQWLMEPNHHQQEFERHILKIQDFQVTEKSVITVVPNSLLSSKDLHEDTALLPFSHIVITEYISDPSLTTDKHQCHRPDYVSNSHRLDTFTCKERGVDTSLWNLTCEDNVPLSHKDNNIQLDLHTSPQTATPSLMCDLLTNADRGVSPMNCGAEYIVNTAFLGTADPEIMAGQIRSTHMTCETNYISNSCFTAEATANTNE